MFKDREALQSMAIKWVISTITLDTIILDSIIC